MQLAFDIRTILPLCAFAGAVILAARVWRYRNKRLALIFVVLMSAVAWWSLAAFIEHGSVDLSSKIFWMNMSYFGIAAIPLAWLLFSLEYTGREKWFTPRNIALLAIIPVTTLVIVWTNNASHLMWKDIWLDTSFSPPVDAVTHNWWFWIYAAYSYSLLMIGTVFLFKSFRQSQDLYRKQLGIMLLGTLAPWVANALFIAGVKPFTVVAPTPQALIITGVAFFWGLSRFQLLDIMPIAQDAIFKSMLDGVIVLDTQQRVIELNPTAQKMVGRDRSEVIGQPYDLVLPRMPDLNKVKAEPIETESLTVRGDDGTELSYELYRSPIVTRQHPSGHLLILHDITERRKAESESRERAILETELVERKRAEAALRMSEAKFRNLVENAAAGILTTCLDGRILSANRAAQQILGYDLEGELTATSMMIAYADPDARRHLLSLIEEKGVAKGYEARLKHKDGTQFWASLNVITQVTESGEQQLLTIIEDITGRKQAANQLTRLNRELKSLNFELEDKVEERTKQLGEAVLAANASNQAKSDFLASMSHELRTPLNAILGFSQLLQEKYFGPLNEKQEEYVGDILGSGQHLLTLINDILDLSKIEAGKLELHPSPVKIANLVDGSLIMVKERAFKNGIALSLKIGPEVTANEYILDELKIKQVMYNLLSNAVKFTPNGGKISIELRQQADQLIVTVADTGIGIPPEHQARLFTEFYQVQSGLVAKTPGTGLGLAISKRMVEMHGGKIWVESDGLGNGSRFIFTLPAKKEERVERTEDVEEDRTRCR